MPGVHRLRLDQLLAWIAIPDEWLQFYLIQDSKHRHGTFFSLQGLTDCPGKFGKIDLRCKTSWDMPVLNEFTLETVKLLECMKLRWQLLHRPDTKSNLMYERPHMG